MNWKTFCFVVRTLPVFVRECIRMGWAKWRGRVYVAPRDKVSGDECRVTGGNVCYRPDAGRFGAVVKFPQTGTGYIVGRGGNLVNPKRQAKKKKALGIRP